MTIVRTGDLVSSKTTGVPSVSEIQTRGRSQRTHGDDEVTRTRAKTQTPTHRPGETLEQNEFCLERRLPTESRFTLSVRS